MSNQRNATYFRILADRTPVNVGAAYSAIFGPLDLNLFDALAIEVQNPDVTQVVDVEVDVATRVGGPFPTTPTLLFSALMAIQPGETRPAIFNKPGQNFVRLIAKADGAGVNNVILSVSGVETKLIS